MNKIKKGDQVIVITGRDKGKTGEILQILDDGRVLVNDIQLVKKHVKANPMACLLYTSPSPRDKRQSRMPSSA